MIRKAEISDAKNFFQTHLDCWKETYELFFQPEVFLKREVRANERINHIKTRIENNYPYFVLELNNKIEGIMILTVDPRNNLGIIDSLYIRKKYQRQGYGTEFLNLALNYFKNLGYLNVTTFCIQGLPANQFFLQFTTKQLDDSLITISGRDFIEHNYLFGSDNND